MNSFCHNLVNIYTHQNTLSKNLLRNQKSLVLQEGQLFNCYSVCITVQGENVKMLCFSMPCIWHMVIPPYNVAVILFKQKCVSAHIRATHPPLNKQIDTYIT